MSTAGRRNLTLRCLLFDAGADELSFLDDSAGLSALPNYRIHIRYSDGAQGEVDLSEFAGKGDFAAWDDPDCFRRVEIEAHRQIHWSDEVELCPDAIYLKFAGNSPEEYFAAAPREAAYA